MLKDQINKELAEAMKNKDAVRTSALRNIKAKILESQKTEVGKDVSDHEVQAILMKLAKERKQSIEMYQKGNRQDLVDSETAELEIIESYLPKQMTADQISGKVSEIISENGFSGMKDMGKAMKIFNEKYPNMAEGKVLSQIVKDNLAG